MTLGQKTRWAYSTMLTSPHRAPLWGTPSQESRAQNLTFSDFAQCELTVKISPKSVHNILSYHVCVGVCVCASV